MNQQNRTEAAAHKADTPSKPKTLSKSVLGHLNRRLKKEVERYGTNYPNTAEQYC